MEYMGLSITLGVVALIIVIIIVVFVCGSHMGFIEHAKSIKEGMTQEEVINIMGEPTSREKSGSKTVLIWEDTQWKGIQHGGTLTRSVKVFFQKNIVVSISYKNLDKSTFW